MLRPSFLAGQWYPDSDAACRKAIEGHAATAVAEQGPYRGLIGPHAGWHYSGKAAAHVYAALGGVHKDADLVVVFGSHRGVDGPHTVFCATGWETPLGVLKTALPLADDVRASLGLREEPVRPAYPDNAVELHLPFVRYFFPRAELLMLGVGASASAIAIGTEVAELARAAGRNAVFVGSTDLTHYGPNYDFEPMGQGERAVTWVREENDRAFVDAVLQQDPPRVIAHGVSAQSACCPGAVAAALAAVMRYGGGHAAPLLVDHYLSSDVQPSASFVGYAGILL